MATEPVKKSLDSMFNPNMWMGGGTVTPGHIFAAIL